MEASKSERGVAAHTLQGGHSPVTICDLPTEILNHVFKIVVIQNSGRRARISDVDSIFASSSVDIVRLRALQQLRLVCQLFNQVASPYILPTVNVSLNQESLDRLVAISQNPAIACGVRRIRLDLRYRPAEVANDLRLYAESVEGLMNRIRTTLDWASETYNIDGTKLGRGITYGENSRIVRTLGAYCDGMRAAWDSLVGRTAHLQVEVSERSPDAMEEYLSEEKGGLHHKRNDEHTVKRAQRLLQKAHEQYQAMHKEQFRLLTNGVFATTIVSAATRMPRFDSLIFADSGPAQARRFYGHKLEDVIRVLQREELLLEQLSTPSHWKELEDISLKHRAELTPVGLLHVLPVALHEAGVQLRDLSLSCFPLRSNFSLLSPDTPSDGSSQWQTFRAACASLQVFRFDPDWVHSSSHPLARDAHISGESKACIDGYLNAVLSGKRLEKLYLDMHSLGMNADRGASYHAWYDVNSVLEHVNWPRMKEFDISNMRLGEASLLAMCENVGPHLNNIYLSRIALVDGTWFLATEALRNSYKAGDRQKTQRSGVKLMEPLRGGEFEAEARSSQLDPLTSTVPPKSSKMILIGLAEYIAGTGPTTNPLLNLGQYRRQAFRST
ncbi:hypothetical protein HJFPF1_10479 [Paramyrothecium foliicola]|nr:hypothetical protein HJFPF1_10479 [Paramyrothecium foliicola]